MDSDIYDAAVFGDFIEVRRIIKIDPDSVRSTDEFGFTPLHGVAGEDQYKMARLLLSHGANVNAKNDAGITPLHLAVYPKMVRILIEAGADIEAIDAGGATPLHAATEHPELLDVMRMLLKLGAKVNPFDSRGNTPLDIAVEREEATKIELLRSFGGKCRSEA